MTRAEFQCLHWQLNAATVPLGLAASCTTQAQIIVSTPEILILN